MKLVSAVITTCNRGPEIVERALKSILSQTYKNIETIVVDDSPSTFDKRDSVRNMVASYPGVKYICQETPRGACAARNAGLAAAHGEYIAFLDDDDEWLPFKIEKQIKGFTDTDVAIVYCDNETMNDLTSEITHRARKTYTGNVYRELLRKNFIGSTSFPLMRTEYLRGIDGFDVLMQSSQDWDVWLRLAKSHTVKYVDEVLVRYHIHGYDQITKGAGRRVAGLERIYEKNKEHIDHDRKAFWYIKMVTIPFYCRNGQTDKAIKSWIKAVLRCPWKVKSNVTYLYSIYCNSRMK